MVSICCISYNHEPYIRQCIEGFVMQRTKFLYEILIHDDASTDNTQNIIKEYQEKYPDIIKPIYQKENQYSKGLNGSINATFNLPRARGKYIAMCEGDDYWTDPLKLQKQFDFMEANPDYSLCFHPAYVKFEDNIQEENLYRKWEDKDYSCLEILEQWTIPTASVFYRRDALKDEYHKISSNPDFLFGDIVLFTYLGQQGKIKCINTYMSVYRRNIKSVINIKHEGIEYIKHYAAMKSYIDKECRQFIKKKESQFYTAEGLYKFVREKKIKGLILLLKGIMLSPMPLFNTIKNKFYSYISIIISTKSNIK